MTDLLDRIAVRTPCGRCGGAYDVTLRQILAAQDQMHEGCLVADERDCPPLTYSPLADRATVEAFAETWERLVRHVEQHGRSLRILGAR
jgi:hypothetical protein